MYLCLSSRLIMVCTSGESSSLSGSEELNDLLLGEIVDLFGGETSEGVFLKTFFFFRGCGHEWLILIINICELISK